MVGETTSEDQQPLSWLTVCVWRLLVATGTAPAAIASVTGTSVAEVAAVVDGRRYPQLPGAVTQGASVAPLLHRARLELRRSLDLLERGCGPLACWPSRGWLTPDGRAGRGSRLLGTRSLARQVLMVTSNTLDPDPALVAAHVCHDPRCGNPRCLVWETRAGNGGHRRLARLGIPVSARAESEIAHLDVLDWPLADLETLAVLKRELRGGVRDPESGCLVPADPAAHGHYRTVRLYGRGHKLHRLLLQSTGVDLDGLYALHSCDRRDCFAVAHLRGGTARQNSWDAVDRGRLPSGGSHGRAIYDDSQVDQLREAARRAGTRQVPPGLAGHRQTWRRALRGDTYRSASAPPLEMPRQRRLSTRGVVVVRVLIAAGVADTALTQQLGLSQDYLRDLAAGRQRGDVGGPRTPRPGHATGRQVDQGKLSPQDDAYIARRIGEGASLGALARELEVHPRTIGRAYRRHLGRS